MNSLQQICPKCGKVTSGLHDNLCPECFAEHFQLIEAPLVTHPRICHKCAAMFRNGTWEQVRFALRDFDEAIGEDITTAAADAVLVHEDAEDVAVSVEPRKLTESRYDADVTVEAMV
ncbi:MAG: hypothetical protein KAH86_03090, partial [Methanosarcinales archaeon]|nr:hypothetical protein [Methanosarcinales archaeon]